MGLVYGAYGLRRGGCIGSCWGNRREGDNWGDLGVNVWIILGWISRVYGLDWADPGYREVADDFEYGNDHWGSVKCGEFLD